MIKHALVQLMEVTGLSSISRYIYRNRPIILMYHRILEHPLVPGVSPALFDKQLAYLKSHFRVIPINQLVEEIKRDQVQPNSVAITFDDGHQDFYTNAWPLLQAHQLPASIYVATGFIDNQCWLWPDLLRYQLMNTNLDSLNLPELRSLSLARPDLLKTWATLADYCLQMEPDARQLFLEQVGIKLDATAPQAPLPPFDPLTWAQLREMNRAGLDVGSHTVSHPILSGLSKESLEQELADSYERILHELGHPPSGMCYPNGMARDVSPFVEQYSAGLYQYGLVAYPATVKKENIMHLGRWGGASTFSRFKQIMNGTTRNDNVRGEYR